MVMLQGVPKAGAGGEAAEYRLQEHCHERQARQRCRRRPALRQVLG